MSVEPSDEFMRNLSPDEDPYYGSNSEPSLQSKHSSRPKLSNFDPYQSIYSDSGISASEADSDTPNPDDDDRIIIFKLEAKVDSSGVGCQISITDFDNGVTYFMPAPKAESKINFWKYARQLQERRLPLDKCIGENCSYSASKYINVLFGKTQDHAIVAHAFFNTEDKNGKRFVIPQFVVTRKTLTEKDYFIKLGGNPVTAVKQAIRNTQKGSQ